MDTRPTACSEVSVAPVQEPLPSKPAHLPNVCLAGAPNAGKTALMNCLTGGAFHTANYPGVTVTISKGRSKSEYGPVVALVDLPGVQSPIAPSPEEELSCRVLEGRNDVIKPDALILVVDATQIERHLKFAAYAAALGRPSVIALTMIDLLAKNGQSVNTRKLSEAVGVPVIPVDGRTGWGALELMNTLREVVARPYVSSRLASLPADPVEAYRAIRELLDQSGAIRSSKALTLAQNSFTAKIDRIVLNRYFGFPIFFTILGGLFASIFWLARPFMDLVEWGFKQGGDLVLRILPDGVVARFIAEGVIGGVGAVAVFFPQIVILFFLMTLLEDSGYLSRGAALVDKPLSFLGLHGRSFVPMLSGYACAIPAVLAARTIPSRRERLLTIWILPLMSCSARLPVYALLLAALLPGSVARAGLALATIYISSLLAGALTAGVVGKFILKKEPASMLAMEMPLYRRPLLKPLLRITWSRSSAYLRRAGTPIVIISSVLWLLSNFGLGSRQPVDPEGHRASVLSPAKLETSFAAQLGQTMEPMLHPMGVDWRVGVGLISAFAAREVFVSTMAIVFNVADEGDSQQGLLQSMQAATFPDGTRPIFTTSSIIGLIIFFFISLQCLSTVAVVRSETGSWRIAALQLLFYTGLGYLLSSGVVQSLRLLGVS